MSIAGTSGMDGLDPENPYGLTVVEQQVVELLLSGLTGEEVADLLTIDRRRVALCRASAMRKYGARNGLHLAHLVEITRRPMRQQQIIALEDVPSGITV
jgi:DNA-binding CsgD family transcriptional regulator